MTKIQNDATCKNKRHAGSTPATLKLIKMIALELNSSKYINL